MHTLREWLAEDEQAINIDHDVKMSVAATLRPPSRQRFLRPFLFPAFTLATLIIVLAAAPLRTNPLHDATPHTFLQRAQAYHAANPPAAQTVRHRIVEVTQNDDSTITHETWSSTDGSFVAEFLLVNGRRITASMMVDGVPFVTPEQNALERASHDRYPDPHALPYEPVAPEGVTKIDIDTDPANPDIHCYSIEWMPNATRELDSLMQILQGNDTPAIINALAASTYVEELGNRDLHALGPVTVFRVQFDFADDRFVGEYYFDRSSYALRRYTLGEGANMHTCNITLDEALEWESVPLSVRDAEQLGLEPLFSPTGMPRPRLPVSEACYSYDLATQELTQLSDTEADAVRQRIAARTQ